MSWEILLSSYNCFYHIDKGKNYCDLLSSKCCQEVECPMVDKFLKKYLLGHEYDIAINENDFGVLKGTFEAVIGREPKLELG